MSKEKTFGVVGTAVNPNGTIKVRWANDLVSRLKILIKAGCSDIDLIELPKAMTKLKAAQHFLANRGELNPAQEEILTLKIAEKTRTRKRADVKATITKNIGTRVKSKKATNPKVAKFIKKETTEA